MTDLLALTKRLVRAIEWQYVPEDLSVRDCVPFILDGIEYFYIMSGKSSKWSEDLIIRDDAGFPVSFNADFALDEKNYILTSAQIYFYQKVQSDVSELESYTTDAMSVANADKPFANLSGMIADLRARQIEIWHKMCRYNML